MASVHQGKHRFLGVLRSTFRAQIPTSVIGDTKLTVVTGTSARTRYSHRIEGDERRRHWDAHGVEVVCDEKVDVVLHVVLPQLVHARRRALHPKLRSARSSCDSLLTK
eukprot:4399871-Pleurochrysis_carterae.AAC.4